MKKPFDGITILEFSTMVTASFAAMMMAEQGARVIKIEPIVMGDPMRFLGSSKGGISALFANANRGKESLRLDLKRPEAIEVVEQLATMADVVIHNFRPGVMDGLGLGSEKLRKANPKLVYAAISGFGTKGPLSGAPAYDPIVQAHTGITAVQGEDGSAFVRNLICDKITAYSACQAVTAALWQREKSGEGQHIDLSMLDAGLFFIFPDGFMHHTLLDEDVIPQPPLNELIYRLIHTSDGSITVSAATAAQQQGILKALGKISLLQDERFSTPDAMLANIATYQAIIHDSFLTFSTDEILQQLRLNDVPAAKCLDFEEVLHQEQLIAMETVHVAEHPIMGSMRQVASPARFGGVQLPPGGPAPAHGQHTRSILTELGLTEQLIERYSRDSIAL